ncbi:transcription factor bHLH19-like [Trifolium pratense]|uniref:transcription factor bHLH19-like n=1 Tax=Trifolium pratense TaxID=57577 RepID=UPI001E6920E0|nr:transcription factor bHLH19-like [Trifolium pratense]
MEDLWENWISSLEMGGDKSLSMDDDKFLIENVQEPTFPFENANNSQFSTIVDNVCVTTTIHEKMLNNSNSSNSRISQEYYDATNSKQLEPSQFILSFENTTVEPSPNSATFLSIMDNNVSELPKVKQRTKNHRSSSEIQEHIIAERKRRKIISERFIALAAIIPGLKKTDKVYILGEAFNYVKQLQEKVKELEDHQNKRKNDDSIILIKKYQGCTIEEKGNSCEENSDEHRYYYSKQELPKVEARVIEKEILIEIHCEKQKDILVKLMALLQNLHLSLASSSVLPFGTSTLKVTIVAQMDDDFCMSMDDLVKNLRQYLLESRDKQNNIS